MRGDKIVMIPKRLTTKIRTQPLTSNEQQILSEAKRKIETIQKDMVKSQGLSDDEIKIAVKMGLIEPDQAWWWKEEWQRREREAETDILQGKTSGPFNSLDELIEHISKK